MEIAKNIIAVVVIVPMLWLLVWAYMLVGCAMQDRQCGDDATTRLVASVLAKF